MCRYIYIGLWQFQLHLWHGVIKALVTFKANLHFSHFPISGVILWWCLWHWDAWWTGGYLYLWPERRDLICLHSAWIQSHFCSKSFSHFPSFLLLKHAVPSKKVMICACYVTHQGSSQVTGFDFYCTGLKISFSLIFILNQHYLWNSSHKICLKLLPNMDQTAPECI